MIVEILFFIAIVFLIVYISLLFTRGPVSYQGSQALYDLSKSGPVLTQKEAPWSMRPCTLRFGIFIQEAPKTVAKVDCVEVPTLNPVVTSFGPSCSDSSYKACSCITTDCTRCSLSTTGSYLSNLLSIGDNLELWASGYTSQNDKPYVPALLKVRTAKDSTQHFMESVALPAIPRQRWTIITIVKEGRRFDVYYGAKLVVSKVLDYIPIPPDPSRVWVAGNRAWRGQVGFFSFSQKAALGDDVKKDIEALVNTRGVPFYLEQMTFSFDTKLPSSCPLGSCGPVPKAGTPPNPFLTFATSVS